MLQRGYMDTKSTFENAVSAAKNGDKYRARQILRELIKSDPKNENAWLLFAEVAEKRDDSIRCLKQVVKINPNNDIAREKLLRYSTSPTLSFPRINRSILQVVGVVIVFVIILVLINWNRFFYKGNPEDAYSFASSFAYSQMFISQPGYYGSFCGGEKSDTSEEWHNLRVTDLGNGKYQVVGAVKAGDYYCLYETSYFSATVAYNRQTRTWNLLGNVYFSNYCVTRDSANDENCGSAKDLWQYGWKPNTNWQPPK
jgi:tetratricopeptide (TPR) repeat protein